MRRFVIKAWVTNGPAYRHEGEFASWAAAFEWAIAQWGDGVRVLHIIRKDG